MKMELKLENGSAVLSDGKPVYIMEDGKEFVADVPNMYGKTIELKGEAKRNREARSKAEALLANYKDIIPDVEPEDFKTWKQQADEALTTVRNLQDKELLDAGKVEEIKTELKTAHDRNLSKVKQQFTEKETEYSSVLTKKNDQIFQLMVGNAFANSKYFAGREPLTVLPPDAALALFGRHFKVEEDKLTHELKIVGYFNGSEILSKQPDMVGEIAPIDEAIEYIVDKYPQRDRIMTAGRSGSGAGGGEGSTKGVDELTKLQKQYAEAVNSNDGKSAIVLKNRIHTLQQQNGRIP